MIRSVLASARSGRGAGLLLLGLVLSGASLFAWSWRHRLGSASHAVYESSPYRNVRPGVKFLGDASCARCHAEIAESYHRHPMGRSIALAGEANVGGIVGMTDSARFTAQGLEYAVERRDGRLIHSETRRDDNGREVSRIEAEVTYAVGSGRRGRSFLIERDGFMLQSPISWYSQERKWDLSPDSLEKNNHFERPIDSSCLFCHSNRFEPVVGTINRYETPTFRGLAIGCERCHGPGELHARNPGLSDQGFDPTIVNPARLQPALREAVCQQCHLGGRTRIERPGHSALDYRPGLPLQEFLAIFVEREGPNGATKSIGHVEQMHSSRCFKAGEGQLGCISCHDPHKLPAPAERVSYYRGQCLNCHSAGKGCSLPETVRLERTRENSCIECHMPRSKLANVAHTAETDHSIPRREGEGESKSIIPVTASGDESPLVLFHENLLEASKRIGFDRELGIALAGLSAERASGAARLARLALSLLEPILKRHTDDLLTMQALTLASSLRRTPDQAIAAARATLAIAPQHERSLLLAIPILADQGKQEEAITLGKRLLGINPWLSEYHLMMARLYGQVKKWKEAGEAARAALRLDPTNLISRWIAIRSALERGDREAVRKEGGEYLRFNPPAAERELVKRWIDGGK